MSQFALLWMAMNQEFVPISTAIFYAWNHLVP